MVCEHVPKTPLDILYKNQMQSYGFYHGVFWIWVVCSFALWILLNKMCDDENVVGAKTLSVAAIHSIRK